jgi:hypothetical protein
MNRSWLGAAAVLLVLGCASPSVHYDYDLHVNFAALRTWDWVAAPKGPKASPLMNARVRRAVETEFQAQGLRRETSADPDILVSAYPVYGKGRRRRVHLGVGVGLGPLAVGVSGPVRTPPPGVVGSLVLEIQDFKSHQIVWKAQAEEVLDERLSPEDSEAEVSRAVKKMLAKFPPATAMP